MATCASWRRACLALAAAGEPGHLHAQRLQPAHQLAESAARPGSRWAPSGRTASPRPWRPRRPGRPPRSCPNPRRPAAGGAWARGGPGRRQSRPHTLLGGRQLQRQHGQQALSRPLGAAWSTRCFQVRPAARLRACICESCCASSSSNFRRCQAGWLWSSSVASGCPGWGGAGNAALAQRGQARRQHGRRQQFVQRCPRQRAGHGLAQIGLRQAGRARVDRRQRLRQGRVFLNDPDLGVHHLAAEEAIAQLAPHPQAHAHAQLFCCEP
jgi:hypothetical protein